MLGHAVAGDGAVDDDFDDGSASGVLAVEHGCPAHGDEILVQDDVVDALERIGDRREEDRRQEQKIF